jgi:hypothetical protein
MHITWRMGVSQKAMKTKFSGSGTCNIQKHDFVEYAFSCLTISKRNGGFVVLLFIYLPLNIIT